MSYLIYLIIVGLAAGVLAKAIVPGERGEPKGCLYTVALGIGGSMVVGFILHDVLGWHTGGQFIGTIIGATLGAVLLILVFRKLWK